MTGLLGFFVNPWLLSGLALAAAPIIIHLLNKRRFQVHDWAAMEFLLQAASTNRRRLKFEDLLLLLLRVAVICLLVFTVARPLLSGLGGFGEDERVVVLDDSFSMDFLGPTGPVFVAARESAVNQVQDAIGGSTAVSIRLGSRPETALRAASAAGAEEPNAPAPSLIESARGLLHGLREVKTADLPLRFAHVLDRLLEEAEADREPRRRAVVLVSDFRRADWLEAGGGLAESIEAVLLEMRRRELGNRFGFQFIDVGRGGAGNVAVTDLRLTSPHALAGVPVKLRVEARNFSALPRQRLEGELEISAGKGGAIIPLHRVPLPAVEMIPAGETAAVEVEHLFEDPGHYLLRAALEKDQLPRDDEGFLALEVRAGLDVAVVDGDPAADRFGGESGYLIAALAPRGKIPSGIAARRIAGEISAAALRGADAVMVLNRAGLEAAEWEAIGKFLEEGGGAAFFLGSRVEPARYRPGAGGQRPGREGGLPPAFPAALGAPVAPAGGAALRLVDLRHPALRIFAGVEGASIEQVLFNRYLALEPAPGAAVVARFAGPASPSGAPGGAAGAPAIIESAAGKGRVVIFNTSADRDWSDWPTDPSFVIVLQEWARHLAPRRGAERNLEVGDEIRWPATPGMEYEVALPDGERQAVERDAAASVEETAAFRDTRRAGFYAVIARPSRIRQAPAGAPEAAAAAETATWYACRRTTRESDLDPVEEAALRGALEPLGVRFSLGRSVEVDAFREEEEGEAWRLLALGAGAFLLLELFAAWWFGRQ